MKLIILSAIFFLSSCTKPIVVETVSAEYNNPYAMQASPVWVSPSWWITRYENNEVVCYVFLDTQKWWISCIPKSAITK